VTLTFPLLGIQPDPAQSTKVGYRPHPGEKDASMGGFAVCAVRQFEINTQPTGVLGLIASHFPPNQRPIRFTRQRVDKDIPLDISETLVIIAGNCSIKRL
jgi:hypothetical protein